MRKLLIITFVLTTFVSCDKGELPVKKHASGEVEIETIDMGTDYRYQLFYDCETGTIVKKSEKTEWDLAFENDPTDWQITLNTAKYMSVFKTAQTDISLTTDTTGAEWKYDNVHGNLDSTAIGNWTVDNPVYVIDRGYNHLGVHLGLKKIKITAVSDVDYQITISDINGNDITTHIIEKNSIYNRICFSFDTKNTVNFEPPKTDWDLLFSQYTHVYSDGETYLVTGVLQNPYLTTCAEIQGNNFDKIKMDDLLFMTFSNSIETIGFDWKEFDFGNSAYIIHPITYVLNTSSDKYFKIQFTDFYDNFGNKGVPTFKIQEL